MKQFQVFRYIKKYQAVIAACSILAGVFFYWFANRYLQSYTASAVIEYTDSSAENGQAPNGSPIDISEIYSSNIIVKAIENLGMSTEQVNIDSIRGSIQVEEIITEEEQKTIDANIDQGIENTFHPTRYLITFNVGSGVGGEYARAVLNEILDVYTAYYGENYVNTSSSVNGISDVYSKDYDYIEMLETIDASVDSAMQYINDKMVEDDHFRAYETGYSFRDLYNEFAKISQNEIPKLSAEVLSKKITKNRDVLLAKYQKRNNDMAIENNGYTEQINKLIQIIDSYVEMMSESDNTNITSEYILQGVFGYQDENGNVLTGDSMTSSLTTMCHIGQDSKIMSYLPPITNISWMYFPQRRQFLPRKRWMRWKAESRIWWNGLIHCTISLTERMMNTMRNWELQAFQSYLVWA